MRYLFLCFLFITGFAPAQAERINVVELFTSQGCSSCPPADKILKEFGTLDTVLALSYHVDYWDYIGWKDPYAQPEHTEYQQDYAAKFGLRYVYTPQIVVNGHREFIGTQKSAISSALAIEKQETVPVLFRRDADQVIISGRAPRTPYKVQLVHYIRNSKTIVRRGENGGRTLEYHNSVTNVETLQHWQGGIVRYPTPAPETGSGLALVVRTFDTNAIIAAYKIQ